MHKNKFNILLFLLWLIAAVFTAFHHELWRDEAQAWCIARDCSFFEIFKLSAVEGHPVLWHLLLYPAAKSGLSVYSMQILALISCALGVFILIFKTDLSRFQKTAAVFSAGLLYYIPVIARNYALIPPLLFLTALYWNKRREHPFISAVLIVLLSQTHSYMLGLSAVLALFFLIENYKKALMPCIIIICNFIFLYLHLKGSLDANYALETKYKQIIEPLELIVFLSKVYMFDIVNTVKPLIKYAASVSVSGFIPFIICTLIGFFKEDKKVFIMVSAGISFILYAFSMIYFNGILYQKLYLIILILISGALMLNGRKNRFIEYSLNGLLIISCFASFINIQKEILYNFSGSKETAEYIKKNYKDEKTFTALGNPYLYSSIAAYLPDKKFYSPVIKDYISYFSFYKPSVKAGADIKEAGIVIADEHIDCSEYGLEQVFESSRINLSSRTEREVFKICVKKNF